MLCRMNDFETIVVAQSVIAAFLIRNMSLLLGPGRFGIVIESSFRCNAPQDDSWGSSMA